MLAHVFLESPSDPPKVGCEGRARRRLQVLVLFLCCVFTHELQAIARPKAIALSGLRTCHGLPAVWMDLKSTSHRCGAHEAPRDCWTSTGLSWNKCPNKGGGGVIFST